MTKVVLIAIDCYNWKSSGLFYSFLDFYVQLEGEWEVDFAGYLNKLRHSNLSMAKKDCLSRANCFGVAEEVISNDPYSFSFPIMLTPTNTGFSFRIHRKNIISGNVSG